MSSKAGNACILESSVSSDPPALAQPQFIPPNSIRLAWDAPLYSTPESYWVVAGDFDAMLPDSAREYTFHDLPSGSYPCYVRIYYGNVLMSAEAGTIEIPVANMDELATPLQYQIMPNPFVDACRISIKGSSAQPLKLSFYNPKGQKVRDIELQGEKEYLWDGKDNSGQNLAAGIYFVRLDNGGKKEYHKLLKLKP